MAGEASRIPLQSLVQFTSQAWGSAATAPVPCPRRGGATLAHGLFDIQVPLQHWLVTRLQKPLRWRLEQPLTNADLRQRRSDDSPLKVCLLFDMPTARLSLVDRSVLSLARSVRGEKLPSATLCYVWDHALPAGTLLGNAYTSRVRMLVLDSGDKRLAQWVSHQRDVAADFKQAFGRENGRNGLPALEGILVGADSDNAGGQSLAYVGDITLGP